MSKVEAVFALRGEDQLSPTLDKAKEKVSTLSSIMGSGAVSSALKVAGLAGGWSSVYAKMLEASYEAKRFTVQSERLSIPVAQVAKLSRYAESSGINLSTMGRGMMMLQKFAGEAMEKSSSKSGQLAASLGLNSDVLKEVQRGGVDAFAEVKEALDKTVPEAEQAAIWIELIGQRAFELGNFLKETPDKMRDAGKEANAMSEGTINALVKGQKAYADLQQDISILAGEAAVAFGPILAIVGVILRFVITIVHFLAVKAPIAIKGFFQEALLLWYRVARYLPSWLGGISKDEFEIKKTEYYKRMNELQIANKEANAYQKHNWGQIGKYVGWVAEEKPKDKKPSGPAYSSWDQRTLSQRVEYERFMKEQREQEAGSEQNVKDAETTGQKVRELDKYLTSLKTKEIGMRYLNGESVRLTKEYVMLVQQIKKTEASLHQQRVKHLSEWYSLMRKISDEQTRYTLEMMKLSGNFTDKELFEYEVSEKQKSLNDAIQYAKKVDEGLANGSSTLKEAIDASQAVRVLENDIISMFAKRRMEGRIGDGSSAKGDSLQRIGGGGVYSFSVDDIPKRSLKNLEAIRVAIQKIAEKNGKLTRDEINRIMEDI